MFFLPMTAGWPIFVFFFGSFQWQPVIKDEMIRLQWATCGGLQFADIHTAVGGQ
jgi:hypothetical protein